MELEVSWVPFSLIVSLTAQARKTTDKQECVSTLTFTIYRKFWIRNQSKHDQAGFMSDKADGDRSVAVWTGVTQMLHTELRVDAL